MTWAKLDDRFPEHPKVLGLSNRAFRLHVTAICYVARYLLDGKLPNEITRTLRARKADIAELVGVGLWEPNGTGWLIHDYLDYNPSRAAVEEQRKLYQDRAKKAAAARWKGRKRHA